ncbi:MAG: NUDIX hydrolase [Chloroflexi bacterium]|nr:NUDIX hydrolase [Chloroflexota bacterium]
MATELHFCPQCGGRIERRRVEDREQPVCTRCGLVLYLDPKLVAAAIIVRDGRVLLVQRNNNPGMGLWALPGGYVNRGEAIEEAVCRETLEETGLAVKVQGLVGLYSEAGNPVVLAAYAVAPVGGLLTNSSPEVQALAFFPLDALPPLAFPRDGRILGDWQRLMERQREAP